MEKSTNQISVERWVRKLIGKPVDITPPDCEFEARRMRGQGWRRWMIQSRSALQDSTLKIVAVQYKAARCHGFVLRGNITACEGLRYIAPRLDDEIDVEFHRIGRRKGRIAFFKLGKNLAGDRMMEGMDTVYFFDRWKR